MGRLGILRDCHGVAPPCLHRFLALWPARAKGGHRVFCPPYAPLHPPFLPHAHTPDRLLSAFVGPFARQTRANSTERGGGNPARETGRLATGGCVVVLESGGRVPAGTVV